MVTKASSGNKFTHILKAPLRVLCRARDFYVRSMMNCSGSVHYSGAVGGPMMVHTLPKSFSTNSSRNSDDDDMREVMKMVSQKSLREKLEASERAKGANGLPKSYSVAIGRIDEDQPCYFPEDIKVNSDVLYPRSRSYAVGKRRTRLVA